jgi:hypothetical protein
MSERHENTGLISQRKHYSKNPIPCAPARWTSVEFLPPDGKIFTIAAHAADPFARQIAAIETMRV